MAGDETVGSVPASLDVRVGSRHWRLTPDRAITIGRDPACDVYVADERVSRRHAVVEPAPGGWLLTDHSRNGIFVAGRKVERLVISAPVVLTLGLAGDAPEVSLTPESPQRTVRPSQPTHARKSTVHSPGTAKTRIGRLPENDIVLDDLLVSRRHALLYRRDGGWRIADQGSANGTYLNGQPVSDGPVGEGDVIGIGHSLLQLVADRLVEYVDTGDVDFEARDLVVTVDGSRLLDRVGFEVPERGLLAIVGPSGAGKSTLLGALTGFRPADSGEVRYGGRDLYANYHELRHRIGLVPQEDILHPKLTVRRALSYAADLRFPADVSEEEREQRIDEVLGELGITGQAALPIDRLSGGQRKRTSVALELLTRPSLLFLDEPTSGLDPGLDKSVMETLRGLADEGRTVVVVTHSVANLGLCDRLLVLAQGGRVAYYGPPGQALDYFDVSDFAEVFQLLQQDEPADWPARFRASGMYEQYVGDGAGRASRPPQPPPDPQRQQSAFRQFQVLCRRTFAVLKADRQYAIFLAALPVLLSGLVYAVPSPPGLSAATGAPDPPQLLLVMVVSATLMGAAVSIRDLVKERAIYRRERAIGLSLPAYLGAKLVVLGVVTSAQAALLSVLSLSGRRGPDDAVLLGSARLELAVALVAATFASMVAGLVISAAIGNADRGMPLLVLLVMVQLILCGGLFAVSGKIGLEQLSWLVPARWAFAMGAATGDYGKLPPTTTDWFWRHDTTSWLADLAALGLVTLALVVVTGLLLRRLDPLRRGTAA
ncbi:MAG TPA: FHA domain-containing protein [Amycolatopsis sp.]|nr:FHA domain-containing protein [Amycolatopsis sp.]